MYYLSDIYNAEFARTKGSKDKKQRKKPIRTLATIATVGALMGAAPEISSQVKRRKQETKRLSSILSDAQERSSAGSNKVYMDSLSELKRAGLDQRTAAQYADKAKQEFLKQDNAIIEHLKQQKPQPYDLKRIGKTAAKGSAALTSLGVGLLAGGYALERLRNNNKKKKRK